VRKKPPNAQTHDYVLGEALKRWQWWALWLILFLNTSAGISLISQEGPLFQELTGVTAVVAGGMVGVASLGQRRRPRILGVGLRSDDAAGDIRSDVYLAGRTFLVPAEDHHVVDNDNRRFCYPDVLRRRVRHHASLHRRLLRAEECGIDLWFNANGLELRQSVRATLHRTHA